jgi:hypothetical protein
MPRNRYCGSYGPGHLVHWIQAKKSHEDGQPIHKVRTVAVHDDGQVEIEGDNLKLTLWYHHPDHLRSRAGVGRAPSRTCRTRRRWRCSRPRSTVSGQTPGDQWADPWPTSTRCRLCNLIEGTDLQKVLARDGALSPARAVAIVQQIAAALASARHVQGPGYRARERGGVGLLSPGRPIEQTAPVSESRPVSHHSTLTAPSQVPAARAGDAADQHPPRP